MSVHRAFATFALAVLLAAVGALLLIVGTGRPLALALAAVSVAGSVGCYRRAQRRYAETLYERVGVERNPDGTVGRPGAETERSRSADIDYEPFDPGEWPWDGDFWEGDGPRADGGTQTRRGPRTHGGTVTVSRRTREACEILGVEPDDDIKTVRAAYRERIKEAHPDHGGDPETFEQVRWAYEHLRSQASRET